MIRVLTLNVWFDQKARRARTRALLSLLRGNSYEVCCLQELVPEVARELMRGLPGWSSSDPGDGSSVTPYGVMTLVAPGWAARFAHHQLPTAMGRQLLVADLESLVVGNVHLESLENQEVRERQLLVCAEVLRSHPDVVLVGDFNFDSDENRRPPHVPLENDALAKFLPDFVDVWPLLQGKEKGYTRNSYRNPYVQEEQARRLDRTTARLTNWQAVTIELFGHKPVDHLAQPSPREQQDLRRPPTPQRPRRSRSPPPPALTDDVWGLPGDDAMLEAPVTPPPRLSLCPMSPASPAGPLLWTPQPQRSRGKLFLSDHFGLLLTLQSKAGS